jgi:tetratricopeptide (TPR) repeat protein
MTRIVTTAAAILILTIAIGCESNTGRSQMLPHRTNPHLDTANEPLPLDAPSQADQIELVEQMTMHRHAYRRSLQALAQYYDARGDHEKVTWATRELEALDRIPMYRYIVEAQVFPPTLSASERIPAADQMYEEAEKTRRQAGVMVPTMLKNEEILRAALARYAELIRTYPSSDKIDDAAYRMGGIHEDFRDYELAFQFYQRAYQWDPSTPYPARFRAANILDRRLRRRAEALELYQEALIKESQFDEWRIPIERRVRELTSSGTN